MKSTPESISQEKNPKLRIQPILESIGVIDATLQTASYQQLANPINRGASILETSSDSVIGKEYLTHDVCHGLSQDLIQEISRNQPEMLSILHPYEFDLNNLGPFSLQGERAARTLQNILLKCSMEVDESTGEKCIKVSKEVLLPETVSFANYAGIRTEIYDTFQYGGNKLSDEQGLFFARKYFDKKNLQTLASISYVHYLDKISSFLPKAYNFEDPEVISDQNSMRFLSRQNFDSSEELDKCIAENSERFHGCINFEQYQESIFKKYIENLTDDQLISLESKFNFFDAYCSKEADQPGSLGYDIKHLILTGEETDEFKVVVTRFEELYGISGREFVLSMSKLNELFVKYYLSEYIPEEIKEDPSSKKIFLPIKERMTRLENDVNVTINTRKISELNEADELNDVFLLTNDVEQGKKAYKLVKQLQDLIRSKIALQHDIRFKEFESEEAYDTTYQKLDETRKQIYDLLESDDMKIASKLVSNYYGISGIKSKPE
ncbi:MAG: hypothetical protein ACRCXZ_06500 [Patescibacteria group bacterium]